MRIKIFKILTIMLLMLSFNVQSFACGGCVDSYLIGSQATLNIGKYQGYELALFKSIESLNKFIQENIVKSQEMSLKSAQTIRELEKNNVLIDKQNIFLIKKLNELQGIINNIKAINGDSSLSF